MLAKFHGNILNLSENIAKSFRGATFLTHTVGQRSKVTGHRSQVIGQRSKSSVHGHATCTVCSTFAQSLVQFVSTYIGVQRGVSSRRQVSYAASVTELLKDEKATLSKHII